MIETVWGLYDTYVGNLINEVSCPLSVSAAVLAVLAALAVSAGGFLFQLPDSILDLYHFALGVHLISGYFLKGMGPVVGRIQSCPGHAFPGDVARIVVLSLKQHFDTFRLVLLLKVDIPFLLDSIRVLYSGLQDNVHLVIQAPPHGGGLLPGAFCPSVGFIAVIGLRKNGILSVFIGKIDTGLSVFSSFPGTKLRDIRIGVGIIAILYIYTLTGNRLIFVGPDCNRYFVIIMFADILVFYFFIPGQVLDEMPAVIAAIVMIQRPVFVIDFIVYQGQLQAGPEIREHIFDLNRFSVHTAGSADLCT